MRNNRRVYVFTLLFINTTLCLFAFNNCGTYTPPNGQAIPQDLNRSPDSVNSNIPSIASDPLLELAWHLSNSGQSVFAGQPGVAGADINVMPVWKSGISGKGVKVQISDDGIEDYHEDLSGNYSYLKNSKDYLLVGSPLSFRSPPRSGSIENEDGSTSYVHDNHGTSVAGIIAAIQNNGVGSSGVSPKATISGANPISVLVDQSKTSIFYDQLQGDFDISNMSWGMLQNGLPSYDSMIHQVAKEEVSIGRNGKGKIFVKSAGNDFIILCRNSADLYCIGNSQFDPENSIPYYITVGALNAKNTRASYSSTGANIWVSSFGGELGDDSPAILTTDRSNCNLGRSTTQAKLGKTNVDFENGSDPKNSHCNYTAGFNGTSSAAPLVTGAIALMLEANPNLTWRDVKYILAKTARTILPNIAPHLHPFTYVTSSEKTVLPNTVVWENPWITNHAGFSFHNYFGFGSVDSSAAVEMAKNFTVNLGTYSETAFIKKTGTLSIIDAKTTTPLTTTTQSSLLISQTMKIEHVQIQVNISHSDISELSIELISPAGTKSIIMNPRHSLKGLSLLTDENIFLSNAFYQENSQGTWKLNVVDTKTGIVGSLTGWSLRFGGSAIGQ